MTSIILINEDCSINQQKVRINRDTLYKKCGLKKDELVLQHTWSVDMFNIATIELWAKDIFSSGCENKYVLPYPLDSKKYYGTIAVLALSKKGHFISITTEIWKRIYEQINEEHNSFSVIEPINNLKCNCDGNDISIDVLIKPDACIVEIDETDLINQLNSGSELEEEEYDN